MQKRTAWTLRLAAVSLLLTVAAAVAADRADSRARLLQSVQFLAADERQGRGVGTEGLEQSAQWLAEQFKAAGLKPVEPGGGYFQPLETSGPARLGKPNSLALISPEGKRHELALGKEFVPLAFSKSGRFAGQLVFAGYGITAPEYHYDDYASLAVKDKVVLVMRREPRQDAEGPSVPFQGSRDTRHSALITKVRNAAKHGAVAVLFVTDPHSLREEPDQLLPFGYAAGRAQQVHAVHVTRQTANLVLQSAMSKRLADIERQIDKELKPQSSPLTGWRCEGTITIEREKVTVKNVIGLLPGRGPKAEELIVIAAHYDHVGYGQMGALGPFGQIYNGADDNASGAAVLVELAGRLAHRSEPLQRSLLFIAFTAEEQGLVGSRHYVKHPVKPLDQIITMINLDMVGRMQENQLMAGSAGTGKEFAPILKRLAERHGLNLRIGGESAGGSDHVSFVAQKIPAIHFFTGIHPDYHRPSDDWDKLSIDGMLKVADLVEELAVELAKLPQRPQFVAPPQPKTSAGARRAYLGTIPAFGVDVEGVLLDGVLPGGPAESAGLKAGDLLIRVGKFKIGSLEDLQTALSELKPGQKVKVQIRRGPLLISYPVTLGSRR